MFEFMTTPYLDMYLNEPRKRYTRPAKIHRTTCPDCGNKLVTLYYSKQLDKYVCRKCTDALSGKDKEKHHDKTV